MRLTRLRIVGFKSFVEPTDIPIEPGLTGIVGPNGCGKSNLVEALRWVMGESSHKNMRAAGMDEVIFAGSGNRPARNAAQVTLAIDNSARTAPAAFNDHDMLEVSRRIEREDGSTYRVNGREVRARDVQLLFADAATGARSPALVRQGQISELIAAKPQARRRILEDAAGIAGLHARRHEAELRFKAAEDNLLRVEDVLREIDGQVDNLRRQGRQAIRYRTLSADIRRFEALLFAITHAAAREDAEAAEIRAAADLRLVADRAAEQGAAATAQALAAHGLPPLREAAAAAGAALQRLVHARSELDSEERRATERAAELDRQIDDVLRDIERQKSVETDAVAAIARLETEATEIGAETGSSGAAQAKRQSGMEAAEAALAEIEARHGALQAQASDLAARRTMLERLAREEAGRVARFKAERENLERELATAHGAAGRDDATEMRDALARAEAALLDADTRVAALRQSVAIAREAGEAARAPLAEAERRAQGLDTEFRTLSKLFASTSADLWPSVLDQISVDKGFEVALGAAFGDDLDASTDASAPLHWLNLAHTEPASALPAGVSPLSAKVRAPTALARRLSQIGLVDRAAGPALQAALAPGQRLVSPEGDLWRWDGLVSAADAPSAATRRLAEKNRLGELEDQMTLAREVVESRRKEAEAAQASLREVAAAETQALEAARRARRSLDDARDTLGAAERQQASAAAKLSALHEAFGRVEANEREAGGRADAATLALGELPPSSDIEARLLEARAELAEQRTVASEARAALQTLVREAEMSARRQAAITADILSWTGRAERAAQTAADLGERLERTRAERHILSEAPDTFVLRRRALIAEIDRAEAGRAGASDALAKGETASAEADRAARDALDALAASREARAASQTRAEALSARLSDVSRAIADTLDTNPVGLLELAGQKAGEPLPEAAGIETRLALLKAERERLGGVNLRAEDELGEIETKRGTLAAERDDLVEAIKRLRQAIGSLNREGRERLTAAFEVVNGHFQRLFTTLFGGGTAELSLVDSDDPLEAGLEIVARPPGKKPQTMTLLSGGEQALTATALIFAVFLTNPSPICVLDEVDAPLDDANVERYCDLLADMVRQTETRFVVITHNPITMARMDRLFGVTMAERGVSQLVSVDLQVAERLLEAV